MASNARNDAEQPGEVSRRIFVTGVAAAGLTAGIPLNALGAQDARTQTGGPSELCRATTTQLSALIRQKKVSSLEAVNALLARIGEVNPRLNAVVLLDAERARAAAREADRALAQGKTLGPLHGVPMTLKDSLDTAGLVSTGGTLGRKDFVPARDATVVARLKKAGAILLGKTNTPELTWSFETRSPVYGRTNNPWNLDLSPSGSSGGAAAIIAACGSPFDVGSDSGGSIRVPAHFCGIAGIKPTSGRVSRTGHIVGPEGFMQSITQLGPMARSVEDLELVLRVIAGPDGQDPHVVPMPPGQHERISLRGLRIALHVDNGIHAPSPDVAAIVQSAARLLLDQGVVVDEARPEALRDVMTLDDELMRSDGGWWIGDTLIRAGTKEPGPDVAFALRMAAPEGRKSMTAAEFAAVLDKWDAWRRRMLGFMEPYDAILCPPCALDSLPHDATDVLENYPAFTYTFAYNYTGWPGATVRGGTSATGLPLGVQVVAEPWREDVALALARAIERSQGGFRPAPI